MELNLPTGQVSFLVLLLKHLLIFEQKILKIPIKKVSGRLDRKFAGWDLSQMF